jgi:polyisoprenoid-binding protein YceI
MKKISLVLITLLFATIAISAQTSWSIDKSHSEIGFSVSHMVISDVEGQFHKYDATVETDGDNWENAKVNFTIDVASIDTDNEDRDNHLRSDEFFNAEKYPHITFVSKSMKKVDDNKYELTGDFTMRDVTKEITLDVTHRGTVTDPWGNTRAGFKIEGSVDRQDYGINWDKTLDTGGLVAGNEVEFNIGVELVKQK